MPAMNMLAELEWKKKYLITTEAQLKLFPKVAFRRVGRCCFLPTGRLIRHETDPVERHKLPWWAQTNVPTLTLPISK
jgi:hypothetical protein